MKPWIDRKVLLRGARAFIREYGSFIRSHAKRISSLVEIAIYNSIVSYYDEEGYTLKVKNLGPRKSFRYKLSPTGLIENFSYFEAISPDATATLQILHNTKIQSAHNERLYYTPDVVVCEEDGAVTRKLKGSRKDSYIINKHLITFVEIKHLVPFPEVLFSFTGLVQEFAPTFITGTVSSADKGHLTPMIVFTGVPSKHAERIKKALTKRYGINIVYGTEKTDGKIAAFDTLSKYSGPSSRTKRKGRLISARVRKKRT